MKQTNPFQADLLDLDPQTEPSAQLWAAGEVTSAAVREGCVWLTVPFHALGPDGHPRKNTPIREEKLRMEAWGDAIVRVTLVRADQPPDAASPMLHTAPRLNRQPLQLIESPGAWEIRDSRGKTRARIPRQAPVLRQWRADWPAQFANHLRLDVQPDGESTVPFLSYDYFLPNQLYSVPLGLVTKGETVERSMFALHAGANERIVGTGERFARMDLAGHTLQLENIDAMSVNNRRAYKNVPFYLTDRGYGLFVHTHAHTRLSLADLSTRGILGAVEEDGLDLFFIGGGSPERILWNYRRLTGFPPEVPLWTYGVWMSRLTYFSADETLGVARKLRERKLPCDVIHMDTGWFRQEWVCEWEFHPERFPDPAAWMRQLREVGIRVSLWQMPQIYPSAKQYAVALEKGYAGRAGSGGTTGSNFASGKIISIDFSNPDATRWYQELLAALLRLGAVVIKTDFGEDIDLKATYANFPADKLHNLYALLYQKAAFDITKEVTGDGVIWARAGWAGCQRYPIHWGGDATASWDGMAGSLRGGLHLGLSGFGHWSHDCPGFMCHPDPNCSWPSDELYVRWTQFATFSSHFRYHGTQPREPYEYPQIEGLVREWLNLRYALIPYLLAQAKVTARSGFPMLRALLLHHPADPTCWQVDDQFFCGEDLLVAPVMNAESKRRVYLPAGRWVDFWSGEQHEGARWLPEQTYPLARPPVFARYGARIPVYPDVVQCTDEMDLARTVTLAFDDTYRGLAASPLGGLLPQLSAQAG